MNVLTEQDIVTALQDSSEHNRSWAIQLSLEDQRTTPSLLHRFESLARNDASPVVRLFLASGLQRLPFDQRWSILEGLLTHAEDKDDQNLPHLYWYAAEPLAEVDPARALKLAMTSKVPMLEYMVRRISSIDRPESVQQLVSTLSEAADPRTQLTILEGITKALKGRREFPAPAGWTAAYARLTQTDDAALRHQAHLLGVVFNDPAAVDQLLTTIREANQLPERRNAAITALAATKKPAVGHEFVKLLPDGAVRSAALRALAGFDLSETPAAILKIYASCNAVEKRDAVNTLAARPRYAAELLQAIATKTIPATDVPADVVRQLRSLNNEALNKQIAEVWGVVRSTPAERLHIIATTKKMLTAKPKTPVDLALGRLLYEKTCAQCHVLYGAGGKVGPDITGSNRPNLDYLLENILDPSAVIPKDYAATFLVLADGRSLTGIVKEQTDKTLTLITATETLTLQKSDIEAVKPSEVSMMPDDQLKPFSEHEVRSLFAYLQHPSQVPMLATPENAKDFFNGKDLTGWDGDPKLWSVQNGEIVGKSPGIKRNEFLKSQYLLENFRLKLKVKLTPNTENSGIQFRSEAIADGEMRGYQADMGKGWWGKLYEENGRALLVKKDQEQHVKVNDWNDYEIVAEGNKIRTYLNGQLCVDLDDPAGAKRGIVGLQIHSGGPLDVRFKDLKLEVLPK
jgi:putative heme-binding domain-containing protein